MAIDEQNKLKHTINAKNTENIRATKRIDKLEKEKATLKIDLQNANVNVQHIHSELTETGHASNSMYRSLMDAEKKIAQMQRKLEAMQNEKDQIGAEMVKRNDELRILNEKLHIMQTALDRGTVQCAMQFCERIKFHRATTTILKKKKRFYSQVKCNTMIV